MWSWKQLMNDYEMTKTKHFCGCRWSQCWDNLLCGPNRIVHILQWIEVEITLTNVALQMALSNSTLKGPQSVCIFVVYLPLPSLRMNADT